MCLEYVNKKKGGPTYFAMSFIDVAYSGPFFHTRIPMRTWRCFRSKKSIKTPAARWSAQPGSPAKTTPCMCARLLFVVSRKKKSN